MKINWKIFREILYLAIPAVGEMTLYMMIWIHHNKPPDIYLLYINFLFIILLFSNS